MKVDLELRQNIQFTFEKLWSCILEFMETPTFEENLGLDID